MADTLDAEAKYARQLKRMIDDPLGRRVLEKALGAKMAAPGVLPGDMPLVAVLTPCYDHPHPMMTSATQAMLDFTRKSGVALAYPVGTQLSSAVHWSRNQLIASLIKSQRPYTHILFIDADIACPEDTILRLLSHGKDIVGALCTTKRNDHPVPNARLINLETDEVGTIWKWVAGALLGPGCAPAKHAFAVGTGVMLISREALQKTADAYFDCRYEIEIHGWDAGRVEQASKNRVELFDKTADAWWFRFLPARVGAPELGEDIFFCWHAKKFCDIDTYVDTSVLPAHFGDYGYTIKDFLDNRDYAMQCAVRDGRYIPPEVTGAEVQEETPILVTD